MDEPETPESPAVEPTGPEIHINRKFLRALGLHGGKNPTPRSGFYGPNGRPRVWLSRTKKKEVGEVDAT